MEIRSVALLGTGAVGAYFISGFYDLLGDRFWVLAEGERKDRLVKEGVTINGRHYDLRVKTAEEGKGADLLLVCTKSYSLDSALDMIEKAVGSQTLVISLLNGVSSEEQIAQRIGPERILYSVMRISSARNGNDISYDPARTAGVALGEKGTPEKTPRLLAVADLFSRAGIRCRLKDNIVREQWGKYALNICYNLPQAILDLGYGAYFKSEHVGFIRDRLYQEVKAVGAARGIDVPELANKPDSFPYASRFSTLQDMDAKRQTEVDMFLGTLIDMARESGIDVPFSEYTYHAIKALEEKNAGLI